MPDKPNAREVLADMISQSSIRLTQLLNDPAADKDELKNFATIAWSLTGAAVMIATGD